MYETYYTDDIMICAIRMTITHDRMLFMVRMTKVRKIRIVMAMYLPHASCTVFVWIQETALGESDQPLLARS